ncbi:MAG: prolipoprotein diacylglyceryl transferase [Firmicutes bacterium]|nr:prolipoprotein diacylglyceryl transferase [Bacillota bacterium]
MYPVLFSVGRFQIYSWGLMVAVALLFGILWVGKTAQKRKVATFDQIIDLALYVIIGGFIFAKLVHVFYEFETYRHDLLAIFSGFSGSFFGAVIGGLLLGVYYTKRAKIDTWRLADIVALYVPLGHILGRIGCLLGGCCYGVVSARPWALPCAASDHLLRHPTQIYEMIGNLLLFAVLLLISRRQEKREAGYFPGFIFWLYVGFYCLLRIVVEAFRESQIFAFGWLRTTQVWSLLIAVVVFVYIGFRMKKRAGKEQHASSKVYR